MPQPPAFSPAGPLALRGGGVAALRTAQTAGIAWLDFAKPNSVDFAVTRERMADRLARFGTPPGFRRP